MNRKLIKAVVRSQLVTPEQIAEFRRWGSRLDSDLEVKAETLSPQQIASDIRDAIESEDQVRIRITDFDVLARWGDARNRKDGELVLKTGSGETHRLRCNFIELEDGRIVLPPSEWTSEEIIGLLANGECYLRREIDGRKRRVYFNDAAEVSYDDRRSFVVCTPDKGEVDAS